MLLVEKGSDMYPPEQWKEGQKKLLSIWCSVGLDRYKGFFFL